MEDNEKKGVAKNGVVSDDELDRVAGGVISYEELESEPLSLRQDGAVLADLVCSHYRKGANFSEGEEQRCGNCIAWIPRSNVFGYCSFLT